MSVQVEDIPELVHETLVDKYGESQETRSRGYFYSQSLKKLLNYVEPENVHALHAKRQVKNKSESFPSLSAGNVGDYTRSEEQIKVSYEVDYERAKHGTFDWDTILSDIKQKDLEDLPVERFVFAAENDDLHEHLLELLEDTIGFAQPGQFEQPFFFEMESRSAGLAAVKDKVKREHPTWYFRGDPDNPDKTPLGWKHRTMDLVGVWSKNAWMESDNVVATQSRGSARKQLTMKDIEELVFNYVGTDEPQFGAVNSKLVINKWATTFGNSVTGIKSWEWLSSGRWKREK